MTIQEAIKSGKPYRRKSEIKKYGKKSWFTNHREVMKKYPNGVVFYYTIFLESDILATDWEIKE